MKAFVSFLKRVFCLPPVPTLIAAVIGFGTILCVAIFHIHQPVICYFAYFASAYALTVSITGFKYLTAAFCWLKKYVNDSTPMRKFRSTKIGQRYFSDVRFRTGVSLYQGFFVSILYIAVKLFSGIYYRSEWFVALAVYYILLAVIRLMVIHRISNSDIVAEIKRYRLCGIMLLLINQALAGVVILIVHRGNGFVYPGALIYAMAFYSFYMVITSVINIVKFRRHKSPLLSAAKAINLVSALVSILSLTTAMLTQFGGNDSADFNKTMTRAVGGGVCTIVILMAVFMIVRANAMLKSIKKQEE